MSSKGSFLVLICRNLFVELHGQKSNAAQIIQNVRTILEKSEGEKTMSLSAWWQCFLIDEMFTIG